MLIDAMFFTATSEVPQDDLTEAAYKDLPTFILCNPNAMFYQHMINYPHAFYLRYFLQKGINVLIWNYRGYGLTKAKHCCGSWRNVATPNNFKKDSEALMLYLRTTIGVRGKIGVYGRSLGGIASTHLAKLADMVIVDRSFSNLHDVAEYKFHGKSAVAIYKMVTPNYSGTNAVDMILSSRSDRFCPGEKCYKVITCDINDEIIALNSSLMVGVAREVCKKHAHGK
jgi:hypothetical protein